jgi:hypothetical protein
MNRQKKITKQKKRGLAKGLSNLLSGNFLTRKYVQKNLPFIFFLVFVMICYIGYGYFAEKNAKDLVRSEQKLKEAKAANLSVNARLEKLKQQSSVASSIRDLGLKESTEPPNVIRLKDKAE